MAFEKAKVLKAAEKFLAQGKIDAAIKEYRAIVEHDEDDFTTLNMLGDLCVRAHKTDEAIPCFPQVPCKRACTRRLAPLIEKPVPVSLKLVNLKSRWNPIPRLRSFVPM